MKIQVTHQGTLVSIYEIDETDEEKALATIRKDSDPLTGEQKYYQSSIFHSKDQANIERIKPS